MGGTGPAAREYRPVAEHLMMTTDPVPAMLSGTRFQHELFAEAESELGRMDRYDAVRRDLLEASGAPRAPLQRLPSAASTPGRRRTCVGLLAHLHSSVRPWNTTFRRRCGLIFRGHLSRSRRRARLCRLCGRRHCQRRRFPSPATFSLALFQRLIVEWSDQPRSVIRRFDCRGSDRIPAVPAYGPARSRRRRLKSRDASTRLSAAADSETE